MNKRKSVYEEREMVEWYEKRAEVIAMKRDEFDSAIISMFPYKRKDIISVLELGSGTGNLTEKILQSFPRATVTCIDGSSEMLNVAKARLQDYRKQLTFFRRKFEKPSWTDSLGKYNVVASARAIHHISDERKKTLFKQIYDILQQSGCFVNGDLIKSRYEVLNKKYYDEIWASYIKKKTKEILGLDRTIEEVRKKMHFALANEGDTPATVEDQLQWLLEAGFKAVDCVWKYYHLAVVVGSK